MVQNIRPNGKAPIRPGPKRLGPKRPGPKCLEKWAEMEMGRNVLTPLLHMRMVFYFYTIEISNCNTAHGQ